MRLRSVLPFLVVLTACAAAAGSEFRFAARVDLLPSLTVRAGAGASAADGSTTVRIRATQDRCLDVEYGDAEGSAAIPARSVTTGVDSREVVRDGRRILQITLN